MFKVISGKTTSGKTTIVDRLVKQHDFVQIKTWTNRPMRKGENKDTYHYTTEDDFINKIRDGFFAEWKSYDTKFGTWYYGVALKDLENAKDNEIIILTPDGYRDICRKLDKKPMCIYVYANNKTIEERLIKRGDDAKEAERRLSSDNADFKGFEYEADKVVYNNEGTSIDEVVNKIIEIMR